MNSKSRLNSRRIGVEVDKMSPSTKSTCCPCWWQLRSRRQEKVDGDFLSTSTSTPVWMSHRPKAFNDLHDLTQKGLYKNKVDAYLVLAEQFNQDIIHSSTAILPGKSNVFIWFEKRPPQDTSKLCRHVAAGSLTTQPPNLFFAPKKSSKHHFNSYHFSTCSCPLLVLCLQKVPVHCHKIVAGYVPEALTNILFNFCLDSLVFTNRTIMALPSTSPYRKRFTAVF